MSNQLLSRSITSHSKVVCKLLLNAIIAPRLKNHKTTSCLTLCLMLLASVVGCFEDYSITGFSFANLRSTLKPLLVITEIVKQLLI